MLIGTSGMFLGDWLFLGMAALVVLAIVAVILLVFKLRS